MRVITAYVWTTPNGYKPLILLEELGEAYATRWIDIGKDEQFGADFLRVAPNNKIPAIVDDAAPEGPLSIFESGAILTYLADRAGRFLAPEGPARWKATEWLHWQIGGLGPMLGQLNYFAVRAPEKVAPAIARFTEEAGRLVGVLDRRLQQSRFLAGDEYTIADVASYPWMVVTVRGLSEVLADALGPAEAARRWMDEIAARPAVQRAMAARPPG